MQDGHVIALGDLRRPQQYRLRLRVKQKQLQRGVVKDPAVQLAPFADVCDMTLVLMPPGLIGRRASLRIRLFGQRRKGGRAGSVPADGWRGRLHLGHRACLCRIQDGLPLFFNRGGPERDLVFRAGAQQVRAEALVLRGGAQQVGVEACLCILALWRRFARRCITHRRGRGGGSLRLRLPAARTVRTVLEACGI